MKICCDKGEVAETEKGASKKDSMSRHRFEVATQKEDNDGRNRKWMSRPGMNAKRTYKVPTRQFKVAKTI